MLTELAAATYPDGSTPEAEEVVEALDVSCSPRTWRRRGTAAPVRGVIAETLDIQTGVADNRAGDLPGFLEEALRMESPVKSHFRLARTTTSVGGVEIPAGTIIMLLPGASNRDPRKFEDPMSSITTAGRWREHVAFGRGAHSCPGAPLARSERGSR